MTSEKIRKQFLSFFSQRGHAIVPSSSLIPDDPSVLLTTAGMQQFKRYYTGEVDAQKDFGSLNTTSIQKSFRTSDIDEVGDESHLTFFEMMGNFSFGGYFKREAIQYAHEFITKTMKLPISYVSIFEGNDAVPKDEESRAVWTELGVRDIREQGMDDVFWGPTGTCGPCGPTAELYCRNSQGKDIEVWNIVFNQFYSCGSRNELSSGVTTLRLLEHPGIDTGMGLERLAMIAQGTATIFETDLFAPIMQLIPASLDEPMRRLIADHARGAAFLIGDGVVPSNKERGYVLRRLLRRLIVHEYRFCDSLPFDLAEVLGCVVLHYGGWYSELQESKVREVFEYEKEKFLKTLSSGLKELAKIDSLDDHTAFRLYESYGLPYEIIKEIGGPSATRITRHGFDEEFKKHQELSRAGLEKKFGGHGLLLDTGELRAANEQELAIVTRLHTATHLLQAALRKVLGSTVKQMGSDITAERTRFDFTWPKKMTDHELRTVELLVNEAVNNHLPVNTVECSYQEALQTGALHFFKEKYPEQIKVYYVGPTLETAFSKEFCGGPHVKNTMEIGPFAIIKEESCGAGVRRIRAILKED